mmetsp:Transcript_51539/g.122582  ORF Transcript_51539/g.122582 Transcript_51539/m.122582 type:complete len:582 (+) Transcript_51539:115-1860(+)
MASATRTSVFSSTGLPPPPDRSSFKTAAATGLSLASTRRGGFGDKTAVKRSVSVGSLPSAAGATGGLDATTRPPVATITEGFGVTAATSFGMKATAATTFSKLPLTATGKFVDPDRLINGEPWSTKWRPAPVQLVKDWGALGQKAKSILLTTRDDIAAGSRNSHLSHCNLGDHGMVVLREILVQTSILRNLNLQGNNIGDVGADLIANAFQANPGLQVLCLSSNRIGDAGAQAVARVVESHRSIALVSMESNNVRNLGACSLVSALTKNTRRKVSCILSNNPVQRFDQQSLADLSTAAGTVVALSEQGITLGQLLHIFSTGVRNGTIEPKGTKTSEVCLDVIMPMCTAASRSYSQACVPGNPPPMNYVIHAWDGLFEDLVRAVASHASGFRIKYDAVKCDPSDPQWIYNPEFVKKCFFIDVFCVNQLAHANARLHGEMTRFVDTPYFPFGSPLCQIDKLHLVASKISQRGGRILVVIDGANLVYTRVQTLYELHHAIEEDATLDCVFTGLRDLPKANRNGLLQSAGAATSETKRIVLEEIEARPGGLERFNEAMLKFVDDSARIEFEVKSGLREQRKIRTL